MSVPTRVAKNASSFHGSRYPLNPNANVMKNMKTPVSHVSSRGRRYACTNTTLNRCANAAPIIRLADQAWIDRIEPAERHARHDETDALVGLRGARPVVQQQQGARDDLHEEEEQRHPAQEIPDGENRCCGTVLCAIASSSEARGVRSSSQDRQRHQARPRDDDLVALDVDVIRLEAGAAADRRRCAR